MVKDIGKINRGTRMMEILKMVRLLGLNTIKSLGNIYIDFERDRIVLNRSIR